MHSTKPATVRRCRPYRLKPLSKSFTPSSVHCRPLRPGLWRNRAPRARALVLWLFGAAALAQEQSGNLPLQAVEQLAEQLAPGQARQAPTFLRGERISGRPDLESVVQGRAELRKAETVVSAERLEYDQASDVAKASGAVRINRMGNVYEGPALQLKVETFEGFMQQPRYRFLQNSAHGEATRADFIDESHALVHNASYTTCRRVPGPDWLPDWILRADRISLDSDEDLGVASGAVLSFKGVPLLPVPAISFPLSERRKSGLLPPTFGFDNVNGMEVAQPYYWNIAPNRDATLTPKLMTARGVDLGAEFRYLEPTYSGVTRLNYMPADRLRQSDRWGLAYTHTGSLDTGLEAIGPVALNLNLNRVSDDDYWRDFTSSSVFLTQRLLPADVTTAWARGPLSAQLRVLQWQTLQDPTAPIVPPYARVPQVALRYAQSNVGGFDWSLDGDFTQFQGERSLTLQPNAQRALTVLQISRPWLAAAGYVTPKLQLHASGYQFDATLSDGSQSASRLLPTLSLDSGLVFERDTQYGGREVVQTLEPRAFYVYTPYRDQGLLPNYDTAPNDFNFATIYTENGFVGSDKIADNNLLTLGLTTRFLDAQSGAQLARFGVAQRLRFADQQVTLTPGLPSAAAGFSDVLLGASLNVQERWLLDATVQYNGRTDQSVRSTIGARYAPSDYRVFNAAYRFQRDLSEQVDLSWQWPINDFWGERGQDLGSGRGQGEGRYYAVGRLNYSLSEGRLVDSVLGVEYDAGCWLGRVVLERTQTSTSTATQRLMFQLEFVGFTRLGLSPQKTLTQNISRYQNLRDVGSTSSRYSNYD
ncbi:MAG: LPS-assembly protein LptD [Rhodoferax sp.]